MAVDASPTPAKQSYTRWWTKWPSTHERSPHSVEVVPAQDLDDLRRAIRQHRETRYGDPPTGPTFTADRLLYEAAGIQEPAKPFDPPAMKPGGRLVGKRALDARRAAC
jgi:hypothetical protein